MQSIYLEHAALKRGSIAMKSFNWLSTRTGAVLSQDTTRATRNAAAHAIEHGRLAPRTSQLDPPSPETH